MYTLPEDYGHGSDNHADGRFLAGFITGVGFMTIAMAVVLFFGH